MDTTAAAAAQAQAATRTAAAQATATAAAQPVTLAVQLAQRGTIAARDVQLIATVTIANHTNATIHLSNSSCFADDAHTTGGRPDGRAATIGVELGDAPQHMIWQSWGGIMCVKGAAFVDVQEVPAGGTFTATLTCEGGGGFNLSVETQAGYHYTVRIIIFVWHQGTVDQFLQALSHPDQPGVLWGNNLAVELPFSFH